MDVSVVIPNLNSVIIDQVCDALLSQSCVTDYEIICVGIDTMEKIPNHTLIKQIKTERPTPPAEARNIGVVNSTGKLIVLVDADCIVPRDFLEQHQNAHTKYPRALVGGSVEFPRKGYLQLSDNVSSFHEYMPNTPEGHRRVLPSLNMSIRREDWFTIGGFDNHFPLPAGEDSDFVERARIMGFDIVFFPQAKVLHDHPRHKLGLVMKHAFDFGRYSSLPFTQPFLKKLNQFPVLFEILSPLIALGITLKIVFSERLPFQYYKTLPIVFLSKIAWCFGAATQAANRKAVTR